MESYVILAWKIIILIYCALVGIWIYLSYRQRERKLLWKRTTATIIVSEVREKYLGGVAAVEDRGIGGDGYRYFPVVRYQFEVGGVECMGDTLKARMRTCLHAKHAKELISKYPSGSVINVHYDPENPSDSEEV